MHITTSLRQRRVSREQHFGPNETLNTDEIITRLFRSFPLLPEYILLLYRRCSMQAGRTLIRPQILSKVQQAVKKNFPCLLLSQLTRDRHDTMDTCLPTEAGSCFNYIGPATQCLTSYCCWCKRNDWCGMVCIWRESGGIQAWFCVAVRCSVDITNRQAIAPILWMFLENFNKSAQTHKNQEPQRTPLQTTLIPLSNSLTHGITHKHVFSADQSFDTTSYIHSIKPHQPEGKKSK